MNPASPYERLNGILADTTGRSVGFTMNLALASDLAENELRRRYEARGPVLRQYLQTLVRLFQASLEGREDPVIARWIVGEAGNPLRRWFHRCLPARVWQPPHFFRTDDAPDGTLLELQAPGSLWGEHALLEELSFQPRTPWPLLNGGTLADRWIASLRSVQERPVVHHLLDNASTPQSMLYFIQRTRRTIPYLGFDRNLKRSDVSFVRSHSVYGLVAANDFKNWLRTEELRFDLPPILVFDQKLALALPFIPETRGWFSNEIREQIAYTTLVRPDGISLASGDRITLEEFCALTRGKREYYLKYAGPDVSKNWGSQAVWCCRTLSRTRCEELMKTVRDGWATGELYILQKDLGSKSSVEWIDKKGDVTRTQGYVRPSGFFGGDRCLGILVLWRTFYKVHGQDETIVGLG